MEIVNFLIELLDVLPEDTANKISKYGVSYRHYINSFIAVGVEYEEVLIEELGARNLFNFDLEKITGVDLKRFKLEAEKVTSKEANYTAYYLLNFKLDISADSKIYTLYKSKGLRNNS